MRVKWELDSTLKQAVSIPTEILLTRVLIHRWKGMWVGIVHVHHTTLLNLAVGCEDVKPWSSPFLYGRRLSSCDIGRTSL